MQQCLTLISVPTLSLLRQIAVLVEFAPAWGSHPNVLVTCMELLRRTQQELEMVLSRLNKET